MTEATKELRFTAPDRKTDNAGYREAVIAAAKAFYNSIPAADRNGIALRDIPNSTIAPYYSELAFYVESGKKDSEWTHGIELRLASDLKLEEMRLMAERELKLPISTNEELAVMLRDTPTNPKYIAEALCRMLLK